mmetsp:Transcript_2641/g.3516  ORF Transcript_2641/g.3516 Transcript_2641/m.3516 type:complete len:410 (+) Transcript_2641:95-1324(+)
MKSNTTEATLALKGMLGIGGAKQSKAKTETLKATQQKNVGKKNTRSSKSKNNDATSGSIQSNAKSLNKVQSQARHQRSKNGKQKPSKDVQKQSRQTTKSNENFAWSAFQSPPPPSSLPIPVFGNSFSFESNNEDFPIQVEGTELVHEAYVIDQKDAVGMNNLSTNIKSESEIKAILNISTDGVRPDDSCSQEKDRFVTSKSVQSLEKELTSKDQENTVSNEKNCSGINLAALTISESSETKSSATHENIVHSSSTKIESISSQTRITPVKELDPIAMLMNGQSYGTSNPTITSPQHPLMYPSNMNYTMQYPHAYHPHAHQRMLQPYIIIQVQVPPVLMPGRRMIVPGCHMPVFVPEGVMAGMVIPVSIPNPAVTNSPGNHTITNGPENHRSPPPGSWAARAAASPNTKG